MTTIEDERHEYIEPCCEMSAEGHVCWRDAVEPRWADDQPRCWTHLAKLLVDQVQDIKQWREQYRQRASLKEVKRPWRQASQ